MQSALYVLLTSLGRQSDGSKSTSSLLPRVRRVNARERELPSNATWRLGVCFTPYALNAGKIIGFPQISSKLASVLRFDESEIIAAMQWLDTFIRIKDGWLTSPELDDYRQHLADRRKAQSNGGKKGAAKTNAGKSQVPASP